MNRTLFLKLITLVPFWAKAQGFVQKGTVTGKPAAAPVQPDSLTLQTNLVPYFRPLFFPLTPLGRAVTTTPFTAGQVPDAVLYLSPSYTSNGFLISTSAQAQPSDYFGGLPAKLYTHTFNPPGKWSVVTAVKQLLPGKTVTADPVKGADYNCSRIMQALFPGITVPVVFFSFNRAATMEAHTQTALALAGLPEQKVLIIISEGFYKRKEDMDKLPRLYAQTLKALEVK